MPIDASSDPYKLPGFDPATKGGSDLDDDLADLDDAGTGAAGRSGALDVEDDDLGGGGKLGATVDAGTDEGDATDAADAADGKFDPDVDDDGGLLEAELDVDVDDDGGLGSIDAGAKGDDLDELNDLDDAGSGAKGDLGLDDGTDADLGKTSLDVDGDLGDDALSTKFDLGGVDDGTDGLDADLGSRPGFDFDGDDEPDLKGDFGDDDDVDDPGDAGDLGDQLHDLF
jgi:hypothetical protein